MSNPFTSFKNSDNHVKRDIHDLSHSFHGSFPFGRLTPVLCQEVVNGQSVKIDSALGLQALPMVFPIQTPVRATLHYFYVRNRNLYNDWMDFQFGTKTGLTQPRIGKNTPISFATGSLADCLGVPTQLPQNMNTRCVFHTGNTIVSDRSGDELLAAVDDGAHHVQGYLKYTYNGLINTIQSDPEGYYLPTLSGQTSRLIALDVSPLYNLTSYESNFELSYITSSLSTTQTPKFNYAFGYTDKDSPIVAQYGISHLPINVTWSTGKLKFTFTSDLIKDIIKRNVRYLFIFVDALNPKVSKPYKVEVFNEVVTGFTNLSVDNIPRTSNPFTNGKIPLLAYPFRAYESIYNSFYRNQQIDPLIEPHTLQPEYNKFLLNTNGGEDNDLYDFHYKLWEADIFTSCLPSPQQGAAPLVGIVNVGKSIMGINFGEKQQLAIQDENGEVRYITPNVSKDGSTLESIDVSDTQANKEVLSVYSAPMQGISINDLRNVNALQKYLELNIRKGFRYKDLVKGHFDVDIRFDTLDMPEFLGGITEDLNVDKVISTSDTFTGDTGKPLGAFGGNGALVGRQKHTITKYCDESGFIIGILCITPVPIYTQYLPKYFTRYTQLDYYTPEFANIGMQPILKTQISPLQAYFEDEQLKDNVFGYNQAWSSYKRNLDTAHGLFRTSLRNMVINRVFDKCPQLGKEFIEIRPNHLNDVFASTLENEDKFFGQIYFRISSKSPVPFTSIPSLN